MAKLAAVVESLEAIPEAQRDFYTEQDGKFVLDTDVEQHPGVSGLKSALGKEKVERGKKAEALTKLQAELATLREQVEAKDDKGESTKDLEKLLKKKEEEVRKEFAPVVTELTELRASNLRRDKQAVLGKAALAAGVIPESLDDAIAAADRFIKFEDGKASVLDVDGDPTGISPEKFFAERFKELKPWFYKGSAGSGSGAKPSTPGGGGGTVTLTADEAADHATYSAALAKVGGDHAKVKVKQD